MKTKLPIALTFLLVPIFLFAQKKILSHQSQADWPFISSRVINRDGRYIAYVISTRRMGSNLIIQDTGSTWKMVFPQVSGGEFSADGNKMIFKSAGDSLGILNLETKNVQFISGVNSFRLPVDGNGTWLFLKKRGAGDTLVIFNLNNGVTKCIPHVEEYALNHGCNVLAIKEQTSGNSMARSTVSWLDLENLRTRIICRAFQTRGFVFDEKGISLCFFTNNMANEEVSTVLNYYSQGMDTVIRLTDSSSLEGSNLEICPDRLLFSGDGRRIFFDIKTRQSALGAVVVSDAKVDIRGPHDDPLLVKKAKNGPFFSMINLDSIGEGVIRLQSDEDNNLLQMDCRMDWVVFESNIMGDGNDYKWRRSSRPDVNLVSTRDGVRILLARKLLCSNLSISSTGKYIIWFNSENRQWYSYCTEKNSTKIITGKIQSEMYRPDDHPDVPVDEGIAGWMTDDRAVLLYDRYDIWKVDPGGKKAPVNITHGFGARNNIQFRVVNFNEGREIPISPSDTLFLSAFDEKNKEDGFFQLNVSGGMMHKLVMSSHVYNYQENDFCGSHYPGPLTKASACNRYLLSRMSAEEYPNLFITSDFKNFKQLTDLMPQKEYNWYHAELVHWNLFDGNRAEGILYKPEDFSPEKKYPVIFYYYEKNAKALNNFIHPELSNGAMNIPWFVSNGYLVFVPDIYYKTGYPGRSALCSVASAALYLSKEPWVDVRHLGLQGHSFGGFETNYIVSHSRLFAAAAPASAVSNVVLAYGDIEGGLTWFYERRQGRIGATLWQRPDLYIENSPVFDADKVDAPVLIMQNKNDESVPYSQGLQWYNDLHRLDKRVWMLSYYGEGHILSTEKNQLDYSIRLSEFFNHYLKGLPAPPWMTN